MKRFLHRGKAFMVLLAVLLGASLWLNGWLVLKVLDYKGRVLLAREFPGSASLFVPKDNRRLVWDRRI